MKLPLRESLEAGEAPLEEPLGEDPRGEEPFGELPLGDLPLGGETPLRKTSSCAGSGTEAKRAAVKT